MRSTNRKRAILLSGAIILLCMVIVVGVTWAFFTDTRGFGNHLQSGTLEITLKRVGLTKTTLNSTGYLEEDKVVQSESDPAVDFSNTKALSNGYNVFDIKETEVLVPGSKFTATMQIENHSDAAFGYWIEIVCDDESAGKKLAEQIFVSVNDGEHTMVGNGLFVGNENNFIGVLGTVKDPAYAETANSETFTVTVEFKDMNYTFDGETGVLKSDNDSTQGDTLNFDLVVHAIQMT